MSGMSSSFANLRHQIDSLQALLMAAASSSNVRNYDIRHCLRQIQACLLSEQGELLYEQNDSDEVTQVLMTLLVLNDEHSDPMILEMVNIITQRAAELVTYYGRELSAQQIQELLPRVLCLLQMTKTDQVVDTLLQLLNQHVLPSRMQEIFGGNDLDCWITIRTVLVYQQQFRLEPTSFLSLAIFMVTLLTHLATHVLASQRVALQDWMQSQIMLQQDSTSIADVKQIVGEYLELLEQFGVYLFELSLHLLEQSAHGGIVANDMENTNMIMMALQYSSVATDCVYLCMSRDDGMPPLLGISFGGILTSLWQALTCFVVQKLESAKNNTVGKEMQLAATEALWQLTFLATTNDTIVLDEKSSFMVVVTILRMLQYPDMFWTAQTQEWLKAQLVDAPYRASLRRDLQATTLSLIYHQSGSSPQDHIASLLHEVLNYGSQGNDQNEERSDPWQPLVEELLSEHLALVQQTSIRHDEL